jgi:type I restriction enzyme S subunit
LYVLRSKWGRYEIERLSTGNQESMRNIGQDRIRSIRIPVPPLREIERILKEVNGRNLALKKSSKTATENLLRAGQLRRAILRAAFSGALVAQDSADEPASLLLQRIRERKPMQLVMDYDSMPKKPAASAIRPRVVARSKKAGAL